MKNKDYYKIKELKENDRPREKLKLYGRKSLNETELLALLIGSGYMGKNALELAGMICKELNYNDIGSLTLEELMSIKGIGIGIASRLIAAFELGIRISQKRADEKISYNNPKTIADSFMELLRYEKKEFFYALIFDTKNKLISKEEICIGHLNAALIHPREIFKNAIKKSANSIILIHNHPSGDPSPSKEDILITKRLIKSGEILGINILDHIIIGDGIYISMKKENMIEI